METMVNFYRDILGLKIAYPQLEKYIDQTWVAFSTGPSTFTLRA